MNYEIIEQLNGQTTNYVVTSYLVAMFYSFNFE